MKAALILDCDDVLLDWTAGFNIFLDEPLSPIYQKLQYKTVDELITLKNWTQEQFINQCKIFNMSEGFSELGIVDYRSASSLLNLSKIFDIYILTKCGTDLITKEYRYNNIKKHFNISGVVPFVDIIFLGLSDTKVEKVQEISKLYKTVYVVDDNFDNLREINKNVPSAILHLFRRRHNMYIPSDVLDCNNMKRIYILGNI